MMKITLPLFSAGSARERFNVKMQFPVMRHVAGEPNGAAVGEAEVNFAFGPAVFGGDHSNLPRGAVFAVHPHGPQMGAGHLDKGTHCACSSGWMFRM